MVKNVNLANIAKHVQRNVQPRNIVRNDERRGAQVYNSAQLQLIGEIVHYSNENVSTSKHWGASYPKTKPGYEVAKC